jgi:hypothetical protein
MLRCTTSFNIKYLCILSRVLVTKTGFGLVIGFIDHLQVVIQLIITLFLIFTLQITQH